MELEEVRQISRETTIHRNKDFEAQLEQSREAHSKVPIEDVIFPCVWIYDDETFYATKCGEYFQFESGGVKENGFKFCPYCGFRIKVENDDN